MKQYITEEQLNGLSKKAKKKLISWWVPQNGDKFLNYAGGVFYGESTGFEDETYTPDKISYKDTLGEGKETNLPLLSIGQMIEFLLTEAEINDFTYSRVVPYWQIEITNRSIGRGATGHIDIGDSIELCDVLWEAVKEVLESKK